MLLWFGAPPGHCIGISMLIARLIFNAKLVCRQSLQTPGYFLYITRIWQHSMRGQHMPQEGHLCLKEMALAGFQLQACLAESLKYHTQPPEVLIKSLPIHNHIIKIDQTCCPLQS